MPLRKSRKNKKTFRKRRSRKQKRRQSSKRRKTKNVRKKGNKKRKIRKRKSRKNKHIVSRNKLRRKMMGGYVGSCMNKYNLQYNDNPVLPDPTYLHTNVNSHNMNGGGVMHDFGLGDIVTGYYQTGNALTNVVNTYKGHKKSTSPQVMTQPRMNKEYNVRLKHPDIPASYSKYSSEL